MIIISNIHLCIHIYINVTQSKPIFKNIFGQTPTPSVGQPRAIVDKLQGQRSNQYTTE